MSRSPASSPSQGGAQPGCLQTALGAGSDRAWVDRVLQPESGARAELPVEGIASSVFTRQGSESIIDVITRRGTRGETEDFFKLISKNGCDASGWTRS